METTKTYQLPSSYFLNPGSEGEPTTFGTDTRIEDIVSLFNDDIIIILDNKYTCHNEEELRNALDKISSQRQILDK